MRCSEGCNVSIAIKLAAPACMSVLQIVDLSCRMYLHVFGLDPF